MRNLWARFRQDERGAIQPSSYLLLAVLLALAIIPGLTEIRNGIVQEFGDAAVALDQLDQSYSFTVGGTTSVFIDTSSLVDPDGGEPAGISVQIVPPGEG